MLVVDASCLYLALANTPRAGQVRQALSRDEEYAAPHVIDIEVASVIRRDFLLGRLDATAGSQAIQDLRAWPGERYAHDVLLERVWQLRATVRGWDAAYVALAEALDATLLTADSRLIRTSGPRCRFELLTEE
ncbi:MAG: type II toxin-antitoxin system VapC family toxin [Actinomycetota bacterium]